MVGKYKKATKKNDVANKANEVVRAYLAKDILETDPNGSYTGNPKEKFEKPVQDADDL
ncbi:MAG: hypothetical protein IKZ35_04760 [Clostridia bacterium]|nr:hypothetical protein [Clostridia bacterium]